MNVIAFPVRHKVLRAPEAVELPTGVSAGLPEQVAIYSAMYQAWAEVVGDWRPTFSPGEVRYCVVYVHNPHGGAAMVGCEVDTDQESHGFAFPTVEAGSAWIDAVGHLIPRLGA